MIDLCPVGWSTGVQTGVGASRYMNGSTRLIVARFQDCYFTAPLNLCSTVLPTTSRLASNAESKAVLYTDHSGPITAVFIKYLEIP